MVYAWREGSSFPANPETVAREIESIGDGVEPEQIVEKAKNPRTALHFCFEWDEATAAHKWRIQQARNVVNAIVKYEPPETKDEPKFVVRAFESVHVHEKEEGEGSRRVYVPIDRAMQDDGWRSEIFGRISSGIGSLERLAQSYEHTFPKMKSVSRQLGLIRESLSD